MAFKFHYHAGPLSAHVSSNKRSFQVANISLKISPWREKQRREGNKSWNLICGSVMSDKLSAHTHFSLTLPDVTFQKNRGQWNPISFFGSLSLHCSLKKISAVQTFYFQSTAFPSLNFKKFNFPFFNVGEMLSHCSKYNLQVIFYKLLSQDTNFWCFRCDIGKLMLNLARNLILQVNLNMERKMSPSKENLG